MGYIGSHVCVELMMAGHEVAIYDNLSNSALPTLGLIREITGKAVVFTRGDVRDRSTLVDALKSCNAEAVIHLTGSKVVPDSIRNPLGYYDNNVVGALRVLEAMVECNVKSLVFSSSANVYGVPTRLPVDEGHSALPSNPYGRSKLIVEEMLRDLQNSDGAWRIAILRYFNPAGSHRSRLLGEDPLCARSNLFPLVLQVAQGKRAHLDIWGNDYATADGTGVRDYVHVEDLADGHRKALNWLVLNQGCGVFNLGSGSGFSVMEVVKAFSAASGKHIAVRIGLRRTGDVASCYADIAKARSELAWEPRHTIESMCASVWSWQKHVSENQDEQK